ncbi:hypothetical protein K492DRAFT_58610 [Lichtheimia hyalospora FSU 10163]|nr:hypothetical protein K492DRAFT_58610 [Lichtheimia hyalospora FSU 10163]
MGKLRKLNEWWTYEEMEAVKKGYETFGFGRWNKIKEKYAKELEKRTPQQIGDKARTIARSLQKKGKPLGIWEAALRDKRHDLF